MFTARPQKNLQTAREYFRKHLAKGDYYSEGHTVAGHWFGKGAERLGLQPGSPVTEEAFMRLCDNLHPLTGERLTVRQRRQDRRVFHDFVVSAPKVVSVLANVAGDDRLVAAHNESKQVAMEKAQEFAKTRVGKGGGQADRRTGEIVAAEFLHDTSRALDPQLHTHFVVFNATWDRVENRWKALQTSEMFERMNFFTEVYRSELARRVAALGYRIRNTADGFEIEGVPRSVLDKLSKRRRTILAAEADTLAAFNAQRRSELEAALAGSSTPEARATAEKALRDFVPATKLTNNARSQLAHSTRARKSDELSPSELLDYQRSQLSSEELAAIKAVVAGAAGDGQPAPGAAIEPVQRVTPAEAIDFARDHLFERQSVVELPRLLESALAHSRGFATLPELEAELDRRTEFVTVGEMVTTRQTLQQEARLIGLVNAGMGAVGPLNAGFAGPGELDDDQRLALRHLLRAPDMVVGLRGGAGTGKSTLLRALVQGIEGKHRAIVLAPTTAAVESLRKDGLVRAATVQRFIADPEFQARAHGQVVIVDEAGLLGTADMLALAEWARKSRSRLVLSGDTRQHTGIAAGDALRLLERQSALKLARVSKIHRQRDKEYRAAIGELAIGKGSEALARLHRLGALVEAGEEDRYVKLAADYVDSVRAGKTALLVSPTWREIQQVTSDVRIRLKADGLLGVDDTKVKTHQSLKWTQAQKRDLRNYKPDMVLTFHKGTRDFQPGQWAEVAEVTATALKLRRPNGSLVAVTCKQAGCFDVAGKLTLPVAPGERLLIQASRKSDGLYNGQMVTVKKVQPDGRIELADGRQIAPEFRSFTHGYCVTSHASQGRTVDHVYVAVDSHSLQAANLNQFYVSASRGRERVKVFTDDLEFLQGAVKRSAARLSATELLQSAGPAQRELPKQRPSHTSRIAA